MFTTIGVTEARNSLNRLKYRTSVLGCIIKENCYKSTRTRNNKWVGGREWREGGSKQREGAEGGSRGREQREGGSGGREQREGGSGGREGGREGAQGGSGVSEGGCQVTKALGGKFKITGIRVSNKEEFCSNICARFTNFSI